MLILVKGKSQKYTAVCSQFSRSRKFSNKEIYHRQTFKTRCIFFSQKRIILGREKRNKSQEPRMMKERGKYSERGMFGDAVFNRLNLPKEIKDILASTANMAISSETKKKYSTSLNNVEKCELELNENLSFPWTNRSTLIFIG